MDLKTAVQGCLQSIDQELGKLPILVKAFASGEGLSQTLMRAGLVKDAQYLPLFTSGFSQADEHLDFVLVGKGKERVDTKVNGIPLPPPMSCPATALTMPR